MQVSKTDTILSAWKDEGEILRYKQVKQFIVRKGVIKEKNDRSLSRWLKNLVKEGFLQKTDKGYALEKRPKVYQVFDYLNELRQKYSEHVYEGEIGGIISHVCALTYLNFDEALIQKKEEEVAFDVISVRIGELFWALYELRNTLLKRRCGLDQLRLPDEVVRESFFGLLTQSVGEHHATAEIVRKYLGHLMPISRERFDLMWRNNRSNGEHFMNLLQHEMFFDEIEKEPEDYKKCLKKEAFLDLDKYTVKELLQRFAQIVQLTEKSHEMEMKKHHAVVFTNEESEHEANFRLAVLTKVAEEIKARKTNTEDFAVIATRHPATMGEFYTPEHILHEAIEWAQKPPEDEWGKRIWKKTYGEEKSYEGMVAEHLTAFGRFAPRIYAKMKSFPWVKKELAGRGDFNKVLRLYSEKRRKRLQIDKRAALDFEKRIIGWDGRAKET